MIAWASKSIGRKLIVSFIAIFVLTYALTASFVYTSVRASMAHSETQSLVHLANQKLELVSSHLSALGTNLRAWSQLEVMNDLINGDVDKRIARTLASLKEQYSLPGDIYAFDTMGKLVAASNPGQMAIGGALPPLWKNDQQQLRLIDKHQDPYLPHDIIALSLPLHASFSADFRMGTLVVTVPWSTIVEQFHEKNHRIVLYADERRSILFNGGEAGNVTADEMVELTRRKDDLMLGGKRYIAGYSESYHTLLNDWHIAALQDEDVAYRPIRLVAFKLIGLGLLLAIPFAMAIRWLSQRLTAPVTSLTRVVSRITTSSDLSIRAEIVSQDELGTLAETFNNMAENLQHSLHERELFVGELERLNKTLEQRVQERTQALEQANTELTGAIDNLKSAQSQLVHSEKMASLGQLVAGVAHELNNPIGFIYANFPHLEEYTNDLIQLVEEIRQLPLEEAQKDEIEKRLKAIDIDFIKEDILKIIRSGKSGASRIKEIVSSLRSFSRLDEAELKSVLLEDGINDTLAILHHYLKNRIEVTKDYRLNQPVLCRAGQINQVFMNIIYNAIQAMDGPGRLRIATWQDGEFAAVSVVDTGGGIPPDIMGKIFDPFFTTKKIGEGTGLGLSISYGIVEKHGGRIDVKSEIGKGTEFIIRIRMKPETLIEEAGQ
ncbi:uncharacterized protein NMK_2258 [Novimethylophilus kurashikiensis]|uniref:histidine kinase n=1 Tax=Novimethylophilus kurashikiensis TaxID=1825523 RepID=A0A2R5FA11_9PROT|nr:ATP-binding protein [Novimethylophilus kurashikiensis]GBG14659.1 uncharacterized protein NMK_2258 [Novimethylophilus kurashikiensis]